MLRSIFRRAALPTRARLCRLALAWVCAWMGTATAAEDAPRREVASDPFTHYQSWHDEPLQDWRATNERVGAVGGWRTYLRESQQGGDGAAESSHGHPAHPGEESP